MNIAVNLAPGKCSYFLSLTYLDVSLALPHMEDLTTSADAIELHVDLLRFHQDTKKLGAYIPLLVYVANQVDALHHTTSLSIVSMVRMVAKCFPGQC